MFRKLSLILLFTLQVHFSKADNSRYYRDKLVNMEAELARCQDVIAKKNAVFSKDPWGYNSFGFDQDYEYATDRSASIRNTWPTLNYVRSMAAEEELREQERAKPREEFYYYNED